MELHSYAKRRISKKWTIEQKRKLVDARIAHDAWFTNKPSSVVPWKNILIAANLDDFNVFFVRKQWSNMLARYKQYKQTRLGNIASKTIDAELIKRINQEWEFFGPIHTFMTRKTTNLHSYALTHRTENGNNNNNNEHQEHLGEEEQQLEQTATITEHEQNHQTNKTPTKLLHNETITIQKDCAKENIPNNTTIVIQSTNNNNSSNNNISNDDGIHLFSSDTNDEFQIITETTRIINGARGEPHGQEEEDENMNCVRNTDHDFYSKRSSLGDMLVDEVKRHHEDDLQEQQSNYFADASEESQGSLNMVVDNQANVKIPLNMITVRDGNGQTFEIKSENISQNGSLDLKEELHDQEFLHDMPSTSTQSIITHHMEELPRCSTASKQRLSERDKYYRHKRRFNRRLEKRFDAILQVMGQIVKTEYPTIDVTPLVGPVTALTSTIGQMLSSDSEDPDQSDDSNLNIPTTTHENQ